ncbi:lipid particle protein [Venturia nashicola]|nr:lipid particle protein [Venturia nashicola]
MADVSKKSDGPTPESGFDYTQLPDFDNDFIDEEGMIAFARALAAPDTSPSQEDLTAPNAVHGSNLFITALNDWRPVRQRVRRRKKKHTPRRGKDETREGFVYALLKWPLLFGIFGWITFLGISYLFTRLYIFLYEHWITWRGRRNRLRRELRRQTTYEDWVEAAKDLDKFLGNDKWKTVDEYAYYDSKTVRRVLSHMSKFREQAEIDEENPASDSHAIDELRNLVEACAKNNFAGLENPRLYSETYYGTKDLVQAFVNEMETSLSLLLRTARLDAESKRLLFKHLHTNFGRTALCLSGGATFAYYHFGVAKALLDANLLPDVITGTSGGALVAALLATRTDDELKRLLVPALANRITACSDSTMTWLVRWWKTGARFDSVDWARRGSWFCHGSMTFREAYQRTGRILNVTCVPSDPHSPTILANYLTSPDCVIWSAIIASAAVPGILNPVVLMKKKKDGTLEPYSFGHKWKDGSLRTDIPLKALNLHFNVNFTIVSQVNPHINLFFFSSRGSVGRPVTHRRGRGWRGGFLGSATEQYLKLDLTKWLKVLRHLELLPRPMGQDWSEIWLQRFSGTITIWPKSVSSDFVHILTDPTPKRLARMIHQGQLSTWPKLKFIGNRMKLERLIEEGRRATRPGWTPDGGLANILSEDDIKSLLLEAKSNNGAIAPQSFAATPTGESESEDLEMSPSKSSIRRRARDKPLPRTPEAPLTPHPESPSISSKFTGWWNRSRTSVGERPNSMFEMRPRAKMEMYDRVSSPRPRPRNRENGGYNRRGSLVDELSRQSQVFFDDDDFEATGTESEGVVEETDDEGEMDVNRRYDGEDEGDASVSEVEDHGWDAEEHGSPAELRETRREDRAAEESLGPTVVG